MTDLGPNVYEDARCIFCYISRENSEFVILIFFSVMLAMKVLSN